MSMTPAKDTRAIYAYLRVIALFVSWVALTLVGAFVYLHFRTGAPLQWRPLLGISASAIVMLAVAIWSSKGTLSLANAVSAPTLLLAGSLAVVHWRRLIDGRTLSRADWAVLVAGTVITLWAAVTGARAKRRRPIGTSTFNPDGQQLAAREDVHINMDTIRYHLSEADFVAFNRYVMRRHWVQSALQVLSPGMGLSVVLFLLLRNDTDDARVAVVTSIGVGLVASVLWALLLRSELRTVVSRQVAADPYALGLREILLSPEGFRERTEVNDSLHRWVGFDSIGVTRSHVFLHLNRFTAYIVPRSVLPPEALAQIVAAVSDSKIWRNAV